jgi:hypothetical protein
MAIGVLSEGLLRPFKPAGLEERERECILFQSLNVCSPAYLP